MLCNRPIFSNYKELEDNRGIEIVHSSLPAAINHAAWIVSASLHCLQVLVALLSVLGNHAHVE